MPTKRQILDQLKRDELIVALDRFDLAVEFMEARGGLAKLVAKNHQFLGVENAIAALRRERREDESGLGVFWHTQGSGKSVSMVFFCQKVLRKVPGNWTFVVLTDRIDLDDQIYKNFTRSGAVTEKRVQATSSKHLRRLLREDHRYVFTLIQKFGTPKGVLHEVLSTRSDVVVITDEAHRSQYDTLAMNLRLALPNARFLAFTGTPLIAEEEKTREVFGDYVSIYNFKQSIDDKATVPLFYENRIPELQLTNDNLDEDLERLLEEAEIDAAQEDRLEREFSRQYHLITREDRLEKIAADLVDHFLGRGFQGKAMAIAIDKATAVKMYDKVRKYWLVALRKLRQDLNSAPPERALVLQQRLRYVEETEMAVVVSEAADEVTKMLEKGVDVTPHRRLMQQEDLDTRFKDPDDPFRLVFVCAMWLTGFDAPSCSTIYLDKPMRNHTLMQTIARANRVFPEKEEGLIVDYVGVFSDLQRALAIYGSDHGGGVRQGELPVREKKQLVVELQAALTELDVFLSEIGVELAAVERSQGRDKLELLAGAVDAVLAKPERKRRFLALGRHVQRRFKAILPDPVAAGLAPRCALVDRIVGAIRAESPKVDVYQIMGEVATLLDNSVAAEGYVIREHLGEPIDLSKIDFEELRKRFVQGRKHIEVERLKSAIERKLDQMIRRNPTRRGFGERLQKLIDAYNSGAITVDELFRRLTQFAGELGEEDRRSIREGLDDEELALFDLLVRPDMTLSGEEEAQVRGAARDLLATLKREKLVLDWRKRQQSRAQVQVTIEDVLDGALPEPYTPEIYESKCALVYQHVYDSYYGAGQSVYGAVA